MNAERSPPTDHTSRNLRQRLVGVAVVFMLGFTGAALLILRPAMDRVTLRSYRRAAAAQLEARTAQPPARDLQSITPTVAAYGIDHRGLTQHLSDEDDERPFVLRPDPNTNEERYFIVPIDVRAARAIARAETSRVMVLILLAGLLGAGLLALVLARSLRPWLEGVERALQGADAPLDGDDAPGEFRALAHAIQTRIQNLTEAEARSRTAHQDLKRMQTRLVEASKMESIGRLAAGLAHELGNPLAAVRGYLPLMTRIDDAQEQARIVSRSLGELERMHRILGQLMTYARGATPPAAPPESVPLRSVLDDAAELVRDGQGARRFRIAIEVAPTVRVLAHPEALRQIAVNLMLNAAQATEPMAEAELRVTAESDGAHTVEVWFSDNGPGVAPERASEIFDPFVTTKAAGEGTGLGLSVSKALARGMGGDLELRANVGPESGACFCLSLKAAPGRA